MNMDYSLSQAWRFFRDVLIFLLIYDIICQYWIHLLKRFMQGRKFLHMPNITVFRAIGEFHVGGHAKDCYPRYSTKYVPGAGKVDGEVLETLWAPLNQISGTTRTMTTSHRRETINDHMNDSNWKKVTDEGMCHFLCHSVTISDDIPDDISKSALPKTQTESKGS